MKIRFRLASLALLLGVMAAFSAPDAVAQEPATSEEPPESQEPPSAAAAGDDEELGPEDDVFLPSEEIHADSEISFPSDI